MNEEDGEGEEGGSAGNSPGRFPTARSLKVEDLLRIYEGIITEADEVLLESAISGPLPMPGAPDGLGGYVIYGDHNDPIPPEDLTEPPPLILGKLFSFMQGWTNYVSAEVTRAKCVLEIQERHLEVLQAALRIYYREEKGIPAGSIKDYVQVDPRFVDVDAAVLKIKVFVRTADARYEQLKRTLNNISREQTRRSDELDRELHAETGGRPGGRWAGSESSRATERPFKRD